MSITQDKKPGSSMFDPVLRCDVLVTNFEIPCQHRVSHVIVNMKKAGFTPVCTLHRNQWLREMVQDHSKSIIVTVAEFEMMRINGLYRTHDVPPRH
jgi:hypothetical protein